MKRNRQGGFTLVELLIAAAVAAGIAAIVAVALYALLKNIEDRGKAHPATTESYKVAGIALCEQLHGNASAAWATCVNQVLTEWARAVANQDAFNKAAVTSIPAAKWP